MMGIVKLTLSVLLRVRNCFGGAHLTRVSVLWFVRLIAFQGLDVAKISKDGIVTCVQVDLRRKKLSVRHLHKDSSVFFSLLWKSYPSFTASAVTSKKAQHLPSSVEHMPSLFLWSVFQVCAILGMVLGTGYGERKR